MSALKWLRWLVIKEALRGYAMELGIIKPRWPWVCKHCGWQAFSADGLQAHHGNHQ